MKNLEEVRQLYNQLTEDIDNPTDLVLLAHDLYTILLMLITKAFEVEKDNSKRGLIIDSIKPMTNSYIEKLMKLVTDNELNTVEKDE